MLVANPRLMDGSKRRKRKNDRMDANKLARLGRVDPESLYPIQHRSREVRQDLVMLRARDALVAVRTEIINTTRGLVKSMGTRLPKCSSRSFAHKGEETVPVEVREALLPLVRLASALLIPNCGWLSPESSCFGTKPRYGPTSRLLANRCGFSRVHT